MSRVRSRLVALAVGICLAVTVSELVVRLYEGFPLLPLVPPAVTPAPRIHIVPSPSRGYELPRGEWPATNSVGLRDYERPLEKPPGTFRILGLGDSVTYGYRVPLDDSILKVLERRLNATGEGQYDVLNLGVPGYNTVQEERMLEEVGLAYAPDLILLTYVLNDADEVLDAQDAIGRAADLAEPPPLLAETIGRFYLPQLVYSRQAQLRELDDPAAKFAKDQPGWQASRNALAEMARLARAHGVPLAVAIFPFLVHLDQRHPYAAIYQLIASTVRQVGGHPIELLPAFLGQAARPLWVGPADYHPNARAHAIMALAVEAGLREEHLLPTSGAR